jgi:serine/threonine protein kinase
VALCPACGAENESFAERCFTCDAPLSRAAAIRRGSLIANRYEVLSSLGRGGMGQVYKAHDRVLDEVVAIKVLRADLAESPDLQKRFRTEIKLARKVHHENVCGIHEYGEDGGLRFIVMEFIEGTDLKHALRERGPLPKDEACDIAIQVAEGLTAIHAAGIVHRDLKTPNIMVDLQGRVRLMDFGIAKRFVGGDTGSLTATGVIVGTPDYMSPEQARSCESDARSDLYSLGIVTFELVTGDLPFKAETPAATLLKQLTEPPPLEGPRARRLPPELVPILRRALEKDPDRRYGSAREMAQALRLARGPAERPVPPPIVRPVGRGQAAVPALARQTQPTPDTERLADTQSPTQSPTVTRSPAPTLRPVRAGRPARSIAVVSAAALVALLAAGGALVLRHQARFESGPTPEPTLVPPAGESPAIAATPPDRTLPSPLAPPPTPAKTAEIAVALATGPALVAPEPGAALSVPNAQAARVRLVWKPLERAETYRVAVSATESFAHPAFERAGIPGSSIEVTGLEPGRYYWRVAGRTREGSEGPPSGVRSFALAERVPEKLPPAPTAAKVPAANATATPATPPPTVATLPPATATRVGEAATATPGGETGASSLRPTRAEPEAKSLLAPEATPMPTPAAAQAPGLLALRVKPSALLHVDGTPWVRAADGRASGMAQKAEPISNEVLKLAPGPHALVFEHPDYKPLRRVVTIRSGDKLSMAVDLKDEGIRRKP